MNYYKLINDNKIIGVVSSVDFIKYSPIVDCYMRTTELDGEYVNYNDQLYRSTWMHPISFSSIKYQEVNIIQITQSEYDIFIEALKEDKEIEEETEEEIVPPSPVPNPIDPIEDITLQSLKTMKLNEMSYACRKAIEQGFDLILRGESHHFSLTTQDQLNLMNIDTTQELIPYHADGESYTYYTADEIKQIIKAANDHKVYHTAYYNSLKEYINTLETIEDIAAITYGTPIPDKYKSEVLKVFEEYTQPFHS